MNKIRSLDDLRKMKQNLKSDISIREKSDKAEEMVRIRVAMATCGIAAGARDVMNTLLAKVEKDSLPVVVTQGGCMGYCYAEPTIEVAIPGKDPVVFGNVDSAKALEIVDKYIVGGELIDGVIPVNYQTIQEKL
ncbi:MAG: (2Fe-2S) ferredoxin domain-containing protein [Bacteroidales bacterium]|nr:(2Fe-2S) ferredoxin domain-containing protein [Bacteroidales bacterium]